MPSQTGWYIRDRVLFVREFGNLSLQDVKASHDTGRQHLDQSVGVLHVLVDHTELESAPMSISGMVNAVSALRHPKMGWIVIFGDSSNPYVQSLIRFLAKRFSVNIRQVETRKQALLALIEIDPDLGPLILEKEPLQLPL